MRLRDHNIHNHLCCFNRIGVVDEEFRDQDLGDLEFLRIMTHWSELTGR